MMCTKNFVKAYVLLAMIRLTHGKFSRSYSMPHWVDCTRKDTEIDGAVITHSYSDHEYNTKPCTMTLMADDDFVTRKRIYLNLSDISISDCNNKLSVFFDDNDQGTPQYEISCSSTRISQVVKSTSKSVTLRLEKILKPPDRFRIVMTTVKPGYGCSEFLCDNGYCIDDDLQCDGINHCFDNSDEKENVDGSCSTLTQQEIEHAVKVGFGVIIAVILSILVICVLCCVGIIYCCCKRNNFKGTVLSRPQTTSGTGLPTSGVNQPLVHPPAQAGAYPMQPQGPPAAYPPNPGPYPTGPAPYPAGGYPPATQGPPPPYHDQSYSNQTKMPSAPPFT